MAHGYAKITFSKFVILWNFINDINDWQRYLWSCRSYGPSVALVRGFTCTIPENPLSHEWETLCEDRSFEQNNAYVGFVHNTSNVSKTCMNSFAKKALSFRVIPEANDEANREWKSKSMTGPRGHQGRAPIGSKFFHFHAVFNNKNGKIID